MQSYDDVADGGSSGGSGLGGLGGGFGGLGQKPRGVEGVIVIDIGQRLLWAAPEAQRGDEADAADEATRHHREEALLLLPESCADRLRVVRRAGGKRERAEAQGVNGYDNDDDGYDYYYLDLSPAGSGAEAARHLFGALRWAEAVARRSRKTTTTTGRDLQRNAAADGADGHGDGHGNEEDSSSCSSNSSDANAGSCASWVVLLPDLRAGAAADESLAAVWDRLYRSASGTFA